MACLSTLVWITGGSGQFGSAEAVPSASTLSADAIVQRLVTANARRAEALRGYRSKRLYNVDYHGFLGSHQAHLQVEASYTAPDKKDFTIISQSGSKLLINRVLLKLLESEKEAVQNRQNTELSPRNYEFGLLGTDHEPTGDVYILSVKPRVNTKFLYIGKIWVDAHDFAVVHMEGEPAKNPSIWVSHVKIEYRWAKFGGFWLPVHNESVTQVRMGGKAVLNIDYTDYQVTGVRKGNGTESNKDSVLPDPSSVTPDQH
ncbi:MAG TPA: hypothetical protein VFA74_10420 [Terriglobales bacterium]|nr:hypothetical protein [Terriglobales bacterium]